MNKVLLILQTMNTTRTKQATALFSPLNLMIFDANRKKGHDLFNHAPPDHISLSKFRSFIRAEFHLSFFRRPQ